MIEKSAEPKATDKITVLEGFDAMRIFLETIWQRQGRSPEDIAFVLGGSRWADGSPADPTIWEDWLMAVRICRPLYGNHEARDRHVECLECHSKTIAGRENSLSMNSAEKHLGHPHGGPSARIRRIRGRDTRRSIRRRNGDGLGHGRIRTAARNPTRGAAGSG